MQLAIVHFHLNRGGVSQVILNHLHALALLPKEQWPERVVVLYGGRREGWPDSPWDDGPWDDEPPFEVTLKSIPQLEYDSTVACESEALAQAIHESLLASGFDPDQTILHAHNHALGKNSSLPGALRLLVAEGYRQLLQVHDFAEDFRPANYRHLMRSTGCRSAQELAQQLYPSGAAVHYVALNGRDHGVLQRAGVAEERLHLLANPVEEFCDLPEREEASPSVREKLGITHQQRLVVYPVRGIRRKNVGEMLLYSALVGDQSCHAVTLAPDNPVELVSFDRWQALAEELDLPCKFGIVKRGSRGVRFLHVLAAADSIITTSVAEGFGMVFLEAWLVGRGLVGRDLPEITCGFVESGMKLSGLREQLRVPTAWFDLKTAREEILELHSWACRDYGVAPPQAPPAEAWMEGEGVDFAALPRRFQEEVIRRVAANPEGSLAEIEQLNPGWSALHCNAPEVNPEYVDANARCVRRHFSPAAIGEHLGAIYSKLMACNVSPEVGSLPKGENILDFFLHLDRLHPVRLEP